VTPSAALFGYSPSGPVLTLVLPLGLFVVLMIGMTVVFHREHAMPGRQPAGNRVVPPTADAAHGELDGDDTAVTDTVVSDPAEGAGARDSAVSDLASGDSPSGDTSSGDTSSGDTSSGDTSSGDTSSGDTVAGDPAAPGPPEVPE
jgi:hypothetical protein